nr:MAG TPA: hypothetical protein [Caudoviricetes sp.]
MHIFEIPFLNPFVSVFCFDVCSIIFLYLKSNIFSL